MVRDHDVADALGQIQGIFLPFYVSLWHKGLTHIKDPFCAWLPLCHKDTADLAFHPKDWGALWRVFTAYGSWHATP